MAKLFRDFYDRDTCTVARELVGKYLVRRLDGQLLVAASPRTRPYIGRCDKACHAYQYRRTQRTETLFAAPGTAYIYLIYGMHHCLNLVTEAEGEPAAVLLRGGHACWNQEIISHLRFGKGTVELSAYQRKNFLNGPGKLCKGLSLTRAENGWTPRGTRCSCASPWPTWGFRRSRTPSPQTSTWAKRLGIDYAQEAIDFPWRFYVTEQGEHL